MLWRRFEVRSEGQRVGALIRCAPSASRSGCSGPSGARAQEIEQWRTMRVAELAGPQIALRRRRGPHHPGAHPVGASSAGEQGVRGG